MADHFLVRSARLREPAIGWLPFGLLSVALALVLAATLEVGWVPEDRTIVPAAFGGFVLALWLARRRVRPWVAWLLLTLAGVVLCVFLLARLWPPAEILVQGNPAVAIYWQQAMALFVDRLGGWAQAVARGGRSTETMAFAFGMAFVAWLLGALLAWTVGRLGRPIVGLTALGIALAATTYFGQSGVYWVIAFVGIAAVAVAVAQYRAMEASWDRSGTDYSGEVRAELLIYAGATSLLLMSLAYALPAINVRAIAERFRQQPAVTQAEDTLARVFAGVEQPRQIEEVAAGGQVGVLPRYFLTGSAPELLETVEMTATVTTEPTTANPPRGVHWRATSYDVYTGRGWLRSPEREEPFAAGETIPIPPDEAATGLEVALVNQQVVLADRIRTARYTLGRIMSADRPSVAYWRGVDDLVRVRDRADNVSSYDARSRVVLPTVADLRRARLADVPPAILARYTELPDSVPSRVHELARSVGGLEPAVSAESTPSPYDQAVALESFLRQYPYSLEVGLPPATGDMVDYFLFDLQTGFCDYYASAMVVMARSLGLPARLAIGFLPQPADEQGRQILRQRDAHSWAEIYFAGIGWVEFEPTAPIPGQAMAVAATTAPDYVPPATPGPAINIPERAPRRETPWPLIATAAGIASITGGLLLRRWRARRAVTTGLDPIQRAYSQLQHYSPRLGYLPEVSQTPAEFVSGLSAHLAEVDTDQSVATQLTPRLKQLGDLYSRRQYSRQHASPEANSPSMVEGLWRPIQHDLCALSPVWRALRLPRRR